MAVSVETYLYDFSEDVYGRRIETRLLSFKRPEYKFTGIEELKKQMEEDIEAGKKFHCQKLAPDKV
jgi:riboflavin kinase/FMN adenylyltransferase